MTEYAYSKNDPSISEVTSMSTIRSSSGLLAVFWSDVPFATYCTLSFGSLPATQVTWGTNLEVWHAGSPHGKTQKFPRCGTPPTGRRMWHCGTGLPRTCDPSPPKTPKLCSAFTAPKAHNRSTFVPSLPRSEERRVGHA